MTFLRGALIACLLVVLSAACSEPPCPQGALAPGWSQPPLAGLVPGGVHVCQMAPAEAATHVQFWVEGSVHDANMASVDRAQSNGWDRTRDNWYGTTGNFEMDQWSEFDSAGGTLRIEVGESNGGALVDIVFTPGPVAAPAGSDLAAVQQAVASANRAGGPAAPSNDALAAPLAVPEAAGRRGAAAPRLVVQVFLDYQGPFDARYLAAIDQLVAERGDRVQVVIRNNPLPFHRDAEAAARAALAVRAQLGDEAFWRYQRTLFENQRALGQADLERHAATLEGLDARRFAADLASPTTAAALRADMEEATRVQVRSTPVTFVGTQRINGTQPYAVLLAAVDAALGS
jgi:protein-disulfide isomerase